MWGAASASWAFHPALLLPPVLLLVAHALRISLMRVFAQPDSLEQSLAAEKADLEKQKKKLSPVQDFVQVSKIGRRLIELEKLIKDAAAAREQRAQQPLVQYPLKYGHTIVIVLLTVLYWGTPLLQLPLGWFFPVGRLLCISGGERGHLGVLPWSLIASSLMDKLLHSAALATGFLRPPPAEKGILQQITGMMNFGGAGPASPTAD